MITLEFKVEIDITEDAGSLSEGQVCEIARMVDLSIRDGEANMGLMPQEDNMKVSLIRVLILPYQDR